MVNKKAIVVNEASLVDLKAELYRKETQFKREKVDSKLPKKAPIWQKKKKESKKKVETNLKKPPSDNAYDEQLEKSRLMLEAKSALYEKLSNGEIEVPSDEEDQEGRFLVDFHQKTLPKNEDEIKSSETIPPASSADEWVDYVDSFGRSRKCLRQDLPIMKEKDNKSKETANQDTSSLTLLSDDMRREMIRKKWEKEVEETLDKPVGPVHYQDVLFQETRDHGVGYYEFSKVEEERQEQQTTLKKLRTQTEQQRDKREKLLEKRKSAKDARLAKVRGRKQKNLKEQGLLADNEESDPSHPDVQIAKHGEKITEEEMLNSKDENEMLIGDNIERIKNKVTRMENTHSNEWEKTKINLEVFDKPKPKPSQYDPHDERNPDFAPPSFYAENKNENMKHIEKKSKWKHDVDCNFQDNNAINETQLESQPTFDPTISQSSTNYDTNYPQIPVHPYHPPNNLIPNLPPPPTHAFPPPPTHVFPPPPTHAFPPPPNHMFPPPNHAFPPPPFPNFPLQYPPQFVDYTNNTPYPLPHYYPLVPPPSGYSLHPDITETSPPDQH